APPGSLLILDNFEHVHQAAPLVEALLLRAPTVRVLVTSRELLRLRVEQTLPVPPLSLPDLDYLPTLDRLMEVPSVALFVQRATMTDPGFRLTPPAARADRHDDHDHPERGRLADVLFGERDLVDQERQVGAGGARTTLGGHIDGVELLDDVHRAEQCAELD